MLMLLRGKKGERGNQALFWPISAKNPYHRFWNAVGPPRGGTAPRRVEIARKGDVFHASCLIGERRAGLVRVIEGERKKKKSCLSVPPVAGASKMFCHVSSLMCSCGKKKNGAPHFGGL